MSVLLSPQDARALIWNALTGSGTAPENAGYFTDAQKREIVGGMRLPAG